MIQEMNPLIIPSNHQQTLANTNYPNNTFFATPQNNIMNYENAHHGASNTNSLQNFNANLMSLNSSNNNNVVYPYSNQMNLTNSQYGINNLNNSNNLNPQSKAQQIFDDISKLSPSEKEKIIKMLGEKRAVGSVQNTFFEEEKLMESEEIANNNILAQEYLDQQEMNQQLDYKDCWDFFYSAIATVENIALGQSDKREYGNWDEFDACSFKNKSDLVIQLLKILKSFKGAFSDYLNDYTGFIDYPENLEKIVEKLQNWKKMINDKDINNYIDELINIINNKEGNIDFQKELNKYYGKQKIEKKEMRKGFESVMKCGKEVREEEKKLRREFEEKGKIQYEVKLNVAPGKHKKKN